MSDLFSRIKFCWPLIGLLLFARPLLAQPPPGEVAFAEEACFIVSWRGAFDLSLLSRFGEILSSDGDTALIRTTQHRAELLAGEGAEITRVMDFPALAPPKFQPRTPLRTGFLEPVIQEIIDRVDREELYRVLGDLSGENIVTIGGEEERILTRNSYQTEGIAWATQYGFESLESRGLAVAYHDYNWKGNNWRNVVAEQPGLVTPENVYIICGHIDSMPPGPLAPGADDNASGSTAVLAAAEILSRYSFEQTIRYLLFSGEEQGLIGSQYYVSDCLAAGDVILGALNLDMIAYDQDNDGEMEVYSGITPESNALGDIFLDTIEVYGLSLRPAQYQTAPAWSDQYRFWQAGYPALAAIESDGDFNPNYHTVQDLRANCNLDYLTENVRAAVGTLARLALPLPPPGPVRRGDYNGDGTSELAVFRPRTGLWAARGVTRLYFGRFGDLPVPGDYRGDGTTLPAVFRGSSGLWAVRGLTRFYFGRSGDLPVPGVYGPGGAWNPAIFRKGAGLWAIRSLTRLYFGRPGDLPLPEDYAGAGIWDFGVFRPGTGLWAVRGVSRFYFGSPLDRPLAAAYQGEVSRASLFGADGRWRIRGLTGFYFGSEADLPVSSDYLGDGTARPAVFRPPTGLWAVRGLTQVYFGTAGDLPVSR